MEQVAGQVTVISLDGVGTDSAVNAHFIAQLQKDLSRGHEVTINDIRVVQFQYDRKGLPHDEVELRNDGIHGQWVFHIELLEDGDDDDRKPRTQHDIPLDDVERINVTTTDWQNGAQLRLVSYLDEPGYDRFYRVEFDRNE